MTGQTTHDPDALDRAANREAFTQDALRAWEEYQRTNLHLTLEDADAWLAKLEAGEDAEQIGRASCRERV